MWEWLKSLWENPSRTAPREQSFPADRPSRYFSRCPLILLSQKVAVSNQFWVEIHISLRG
jgi:hypothetical protein